MKKVALMSPNGLAYSETFVLAHKNLLSGNLLYYYEGFMPQDLENFGSLFVRYNKRYRIVLFAKKVFGIRLPVKKEELLLYWSLKKNRPDAVLAEYGLTGAAVVDICKKLSIPLVVHFHGFDASTKAVLSEYSERYKVVFNYSSGIIAVSNKMKDTLIDLGCPPSKLTVSPCGPDPDFLKLNPSYTSSQFVAIGRFVEKKAPYLTILAFKKVVELYPEARLIMIGSGDLLNSCKNLVMALNLDDSVEFKGALLPAEVKLIVEKSIALVQHSVVALTGDAEGTPVAVLEAQAAALPVVSTNHAGIPEVVVNNETGLLVDEFDIDGMSKNMLRLLEEHGLAEKLGIAGRNRVIQHFTLKQHLADVWKTIDRAFEHH